jgi:hypothetical protein
MHLLDKLTGRFSAPQLTCTRIILALAVAVVADFLQVALLPLEWMFIQQIVDVVAMALTVAVLGFHLLLLPTFVVEFIPVVDMLPTWTGCIVFVIALRKREQATAGAEREMNPALPPDAPPQSPPAIDIPRPDDSNYPKL